MVSTRHSTLSMHSIASIAPNIETKEAMKELCRDLHRAGVTADIIRERKGHAVAAFQYPKAPLVVNQEVPQTTGSVAIVYDKNLLEERGKGKSLNPTFRVDSTSSTAIRPKQRVQLLSESSISVAITRSEANSTQGTGTLLHNAASHGRIDVVRQLLEQGENIEARRGDNGSTPLHTAARGGHTEVVRLLLERGANIEAMTTSHGATPLDSAVWKGHTDVVRLLLEKGANIEATRSDDGSTPLDSAAYKGHTDVVRLLLQKGANIEATRTSGGTPLCSASWRGHVGVVSLLLEMGANIKVIRTDSGRAALHTTASYLQTEVVRLLLEKGANIHATSKIAKTALHYVFQVPQVNSSLRDSKQLIPTITVLLVHGANILQKDSDGKTPLEAALSTTSQERNLKPSCRAGTIGIYRYSPKWDNEQEAKYIQASSPRRSRKTRAVLVVVEGTRQLTLFIFIFVNSNLCVSACGSL